MKKHTKNTLIAILILLFNPITLYLAFFIYGESVKACKYPDDFEIFYRILNPLKEKYELAEADCGYSLNYIIWHDTGSPIKRSFFLPMSAPFLYLTIIKPKQGDSLCV